MEDEFIWVHCPNPLCEKEIRVRKEEVDRPQPCPRCMETFTPAEEIIQKK